jgi:hypothetical protein
MLNRLALFLLILCGAVELFASSVAWDGFVDTYYAYDFNRPQNKDRAFTTLPARHSEFNVNLALLGATFEQDRIRARVSLQAGTYVQSNYAPEPTLGEVSGPSVSQHIQDAFIQYQLSEHTQVITGIFPSHIGYENVMSIDNPTYTRSLAADFSPYYQAGAGLIHDWGRGWSSELYVLNGWQIISEDDDNKAIGMAVRYHQSNLQVNYTNYLGHYLGEERHFHDLNFTWQISERWLVQALLDWGVQRRGGELYAFSTSNIQLQWFVNGQESWTLRLERYEDIHGAHIPTDTGRDFLVWGGSLGYNYWLSEQSLFRLEWRQLDNQQGAVFPTQQDFTRANQLLVGSIAVKFD